jgi:hypothetical protein
MVIGGSAFLGLMDYRGTAAVHATMACFPAVSQEVHIEATYAVTLKTSSFVK